jgi:antibiotic biosynthesis monooxygenase (ABM) superfamily enzyme
MKHRIAVLLLLTPFAASAETYYMYVLNEPEPGREVEYNNWYSNRHAPDVVSIPGFVSAQRYVANEQQMRPDAKPPVKYMIEFKIVTDDLAAVMGEVDRRIRDGVTVIDPVIGKSPPPGSGAGGGTYKAITDVVRGKGGDVPNAGKAPPTHYIQVVYSTATPGKEQAFVAWYSKVHAPSVAATPGFQQWQLMQANPVAMRGRGPGQSGASPNAVGPGADSAPGTNYMVKFDIESRDIQAVFASSMQGMRASKLPELGDAGRIGAGYTYRTVGPLISGDAVRTEREKKGCVIVMPTKPCT